MNTKLYADEVRYVCNPQTFSIVMCYKVPSMNNKGDYVDVSFYENQNLSFTCEDMMKFPTKRIHFDDQLSHMLYNIFSNYDRDEFQSYVLYDEIQGMQFYDRLTAVKNTLGSIIWEK